MNRARCGLVALAVGLCVLWGREATAGGSRIYWMAEGPMASDFDGDGEVGFTDFLLFVKAYNTGSENPGFDPRLDLNSDGSIDFSDFLLFSSAYGTRDGSAPAETGYDVYVADFGDNSVQVFDSDTHLLESYLPFRGPGDIFISQDQQSIYVADAFGLFVLNALHKVQYAVPLDSNGRMVFSPDGRFAYITEEVANRIRVMDLAARAVVDTVEVGQGPLHLDITPDGKRLYVSNSLSQDVEVVDLERREVVARIEIGATPGHIGITPDGRRAYVVNFDRGVISVLDLESDRVAGAIALDGDRAMGLAFSPDGKTLYVGSVGSFLAIDVQRNLILRSLVVGDDNAGFGITPDGSRAYVGALHEQEGGPGLVAVDLVNWKVLGRLRGFAFPVQIGFRRVSRE